jgi:ABC-type Fe3+ transport system permease subunit
MRFYAVCVSTNVHSGGFCQLAVKVHVSFYTKLLLTTLLPLFVVALLGVIHLIVRYKHRSVTALTNPATLQQRSFRSNALARAKAKHMSALLVWTFLIYPVVSTVVLETFTTSELSIVEEKWLQADYTLSCYTPAFKHYYAYAIVMAVVSEVTCNFSTFRSP